MEPSTERAARAEQNLKDRYIFGVAAHRLSCKQYALVAQSAEHRTFNARVRSSSLRRRTTPPWPDSQAVKTPALQAGNTGSTPVHATTCRVGGMADTADSKSAAFGVWVQVPYPAPSGNAK